MKTFFVFFSKTVNKIIDLNRLFDEMHIFSTFGMNNTLEYMSCVRDAHSSKIISYVNHRYIQSILYFCRVIHQLICFGSFVSAWLGFSFGFFFRLNSILKFDLQIIIHLFESAFHLFHYTQHLTMMVIEMIMKFQINVKHGWQGKRETKKKCFEKNPNQFEWITAGKKNPKFIWPYISLTDNNHVLVRTFNREIGIWADVLHVDVLFVLVFSPDQNWAQKHAHHF